MLVCKTSDQDLVQLFLKGHSSSLDELLQRHKSKIYSFILSKVKNQALAEDIFQDAFFKVITSLKKGKYNEEGKFLPWVMRISHNLVIDHFRKQKRIPIVGKSKMFEDFDIFDVIDNKESTKEQDLIVDEQTQLLKNLIQTLPINQREVLIMRHYEDLSFKEIAEKTGVSINTALGRMRYALINVRKQMEENNLDLFIQ
ncbi:MAG: sigma-70 family RNA polymerase sigma factor [Flavobacteriales bacterium]|jgi:RNA polymerase sigma-70 factor (ECF subfamily)|tara:strand:+ start:17117 stop:17713 length:597 start_codon:yes stop_codon:yes gene_type:complete